MIEIDEYRVGFFRRVMVRLFLGWSTGYLLLCIALLKMRRNQLSRQCGSYRKERDRLLEEQIGLTQDRLPVQVNGSMLHSLRAAGLQGCTITHVVVIPGKLVNLLVKYDH